MKVFGIRNSSDEEQGTVAYLIYYEKEKKFFIELPDEVDEWDAPLLLSSFIKRGERTVNSYWSMRWVRSRIVPQDRQNIGQILKNAKLNHYDEMGLLLAGGGRCAQDDYYIREISEAELPQQVIQRFLYKIDDVIPLRDYCLLLFFKDGSARKCDMNEILADKKEYARILRESDRFKRVKILPGNYGISWGEQLEILGKSLYSAGEWVPLSKDDFIAFVQTRVVNTAEAAQLLNCSRQYINAEVKRGQLHPIKIAERETLFLKTEILEKSWG